jgi:hypothetical protein
MASIEELKGTVSGAGGFALAHQYMVELPSLPGTSLTARERNALCRVTRLPGRQILTNQREVGLMKQSMAYGYAVESIGLSFHVLNDYKTKKYFDFWQNLVVDQNSQQISYPSDYKKPVKIYQLQKGKAFDLGERSFSIFGININLDFDLLVKDKIIYGVELEDAFPITMNGIDLTDASIDQTVEISIDLSYKNWKRII